MTGAGKRWVVFDLGETLVDETSNWGRWADFLAVPRLTFFAALGAVIAERRPHAHVFDMFRTDFDLERESALKAQAGLPWLFEPSDLYDDALPTLRHLRAAGYGLAIMANQPAESLPFLHTLPVDRVGTSTEWGVAKPDPAFFTRIATELDCPPERIAYVGDRVDFDVLPAQRAGMCAVHLRRGPWGIQHANWPEAAAANLRLNTLTGLTDALASTQFEHP